MQVSRYVLEVECWDGGTPPLSAQALVHVEVLDVNDHPPRFDQSNYTAVVHEGRQAGWTVLRFSLSDADSPLHGPPFRLQVDEPSFFRVKGHELQLARPLPPQSRHELRVRAYDSGSPPLSAEAHVTVLAIQKSRFRPQVQPLNVLVCSFLDDFPGGLLGTVHATDEDPYDHVDLSLSGLHASLFVLDRDDGTLRALPGLDAGSYVLNVTASDSSTPPTHAPVTVHVVAVSEELLKASIALRLTGTTTARFVAADRRQLLRAVRTALGVRLRDLVPAKHEDNMRVLNEYTTDCGREEDGRIGSYILPMGAAAVWLRRPRHWHFVAWPLTSVTLERGSSELLQHLPAGPNSLAAVSLRTSACNKPQDNMSL
ncbi:hypothetical protein HPB51_013083 [Rhipicephalus microplus]|uniref:Cadherin domain-containing protein n=1 Tax=Rhipicephalus microplus TaxID=6941 RepID=A0A9J6F317_RHIMP|nr:hypothetical protein HPB51_013083 [Rhipicephalus microplus]